MNNDGLELQCKNVVGTFEVENYDNLKSQIENIVSKYKRLVVLEDESVVEKLNVLNEQVLEAGLDFKTFKADYEELGLDVENFSTIPYVITSQQAKAEKARLNKIIKAFNDKRIQLEKTYLEPFEVGKKQVKDLVSKVESATNNLNEQIKFYENLIKDKKQKDIEQIFVELDKPSYVTLNSISNDKWLNKGAILKNIKEEMISTIEKIKSNEIIIKEFSNNDSEMLANMLLEFTKNYDLNNAISKGKEFIKLKEDINSEKALEDKITQNNMSIKELKFKISFEVIANKKQIEELSKFLKLNNYVYQQLEGENE